METINDTEVIWNILTDNAENMQKLALDGEFDSFSCSFETKNYPVSLTTARGILITDESMAIGYIHPVIDHCAP